MQNYTQILFFAAIIGVFYFLIIRPQKKRQKDQLELMSKLQPGAEILTIGGIYGTIVSVDDDRVRIAVADGSELEMAKRAIAQLVTAADAESEADASDDAAVEPDGDTTALTEGDGPGSPEPAEPSELAEASPEDSANV